MTLYRPIATYDGCVMHIAYASYKSFLIVHHTGFGCLWSSAARWPRTVLALTSAGGRSDGSRLLTLSAVGRGWRPPQHMASLVWSTLLSDRLCLTDLHQTKGSLPMSDLLSWNDSAQLVCWIFSEMLFNSFLNNCYYGHIQCACVGIQTNIQDFSCLVIILQILTLTKNNTSLKTVITLQYVYGWANAKSGLVRHLTQS